MKIIWCMIPEIWTTTDRICSHFGSFFAHLHPLTTQRIKILKKWRKKKTPGDIIILQKCTINDNHMIYGSWDFFLSSWAIFYHFTPLAWKKNFKKVKKVPKMCTNNQDHRLYCCWDMACDGCNCYFSFWVNSLKNENLKKMKKMFVTIGDIIILHKWPKNHDHMLYYSWDMECDRYNCYFSYWAIFCLFTPITAQKKKLSKKWKKHLEISSFYTSVTNIMIICYTVPQIWHMMDVIVTFHFRLSFATLPR